MKNKKSIDKLSLLSAEIKRITRFFQEKNKRVPLCLRKDIIAFYLENGDISIETVSSNFNLIWNVLRLLGMNEDECIDYISKKYHICFCRSEELLLNLSMVYDIGLLKEVLLGYSNNLSSSFLITTERLYALILEYQNRKVVPTFENLFMFREIHGSWEDLTKRHILCDVVREELLNRFQEQLNTRKKSLI